MGDPVWLADVLRAEGLKVIEHDGWLDRGHGDFLDLRGVIGHHTAGGGPNDWKIVQNGRPDLDGPLAQLVLERDGTYRVIAAGVCWHAGRGSWGDWPTNNANYHTIGIEAVNDGVGQPWPAVQIDAYQRGVAAILRKIGRNSRSFAGHKEYSSEGKIDPANIDLNAFRAAVQRVIDAGPGEGAPKVDWLANTVKNFKDITLSWKDVLWFMDRNTSQTRDQLLGPDDGKGGFRGWGILGKSKIDPKRDNTAIEAIAELREDVKKLLALHESEGGK